MKLEREVIQELHLQAVTGLKVRRHDLNQRIVIKQFQKEYFASDTRFYSIVRLSDFQDQTLWQTKTRLNNYQLVHISINFESELSMCLGKAVIDPSPNR